MEDIRRYLAAEHDCVQMIAQFLLYNDFNGTLPMFIEEAISLDYQLSEEELNKVDHIKREDINKLISAFQSSDHVQFFKAWDELIPNSIKEIFDYKKLTFYLHIHFAITPFRNKQETLVEEQKEEFHEKDLKHVSNNNNHKVKFENITKDKKRLDVIEESTSPCVDYDTDSLDQSQVVIESDHVEVDDMISETNTPTLEPETAMEVLKMFLASEGQTYSSQQEFLPFFALPYVSNPDKHPSFVSLFQMLTVEPLRGSKVLCCSELDVYKIKSHLLTASIKTKLLLLQAIRWRITQGSSEERDQVAVWLSRHDLLSVHGGELVRGMLQPADTVTPHPLQQTLARLLNALASLRAGRDYLASSQPLLHLLATCLKQQDVRLDTVTSDMLLATLQKLSLRRSARLVMIEQQMVEWVVGRLSGECERLYCLEYSTALLLNLCLHVEARDRCPPNVLKLLTDLLDSGYIQIIPMVAGCLYCLLSHERLNQTARQMNLESILTAQVERYSEEPQILRQIQTLLRLLRGDLPRESVFPVCEEPSEDDLDDPENLEAELDAEDPVKAFGEDQCGEVLLQNQYRRIFPSHGIVCPYRGEPEIAILPSTPRSRPPTREK